MKLLPSQQEIKIEEKKGRVRILTWLKRDQFFVASNTPIALNSDFEIVCQSR